MVDEPTRSPDERGAPAGGPWILGREAMGTLIRALGEGGREVVGPTVRDGAVVYDRIEGDEDLPEGWTDEQVPGRYRLRRRDDPAVFGYAVGPHSWKAFLHPPEERILDARRRDGRVELTAVPPRAPPRAFVGVRACEIAAMEIQDRVFGAGDRDAEQAPGEHADPGYGLRRARSLIVAVSCGTPGGTCFCASMDTGPGVRAGFDLALTELGPGADHRFLVEVGSPEGRALLDELPVRPATAADRAEALAVVDGAAASMGRTLDPEDAALRLRDGSESPRWDRVAERCLACANCTMVCPTCFCSTVVDSTDLAGDAARTRQWDSCFGLEFSYLHGGSVRSSIGARYRHWITHKLSTWQEQFGTAGCVGCGRCITWCPVGIDLTEEVGALPAAAPGPGEVSS